MLRKSGILRNLQKFCYIPLTKMSEVNVKKVKYDGRSKKRKWEERRTDKGKAFESKKLKDGEETESPFERIKKRKYALILGYSGVNYNGMQRNPNTKTIEEDLFKALLKNNLITEEVFNQVQMIQFQRAARTDKGVSAVRQIVSLKLPEEVDVPAINQELPEEIRVFGIKRVTKGFNSKTQCDGRTYNYLLPTVVFVSKDISCEQTGFRLSSELYNKVNDTLKLFLGCKNYHNFTSKKSPDDPSAKRYIKSFFCDTPFVKNDVEFAELKVTGQSFMLHQIRKMVALLLALIRKQAEESVLHQAFSSDKVNIPRAPGLGLVLDYVHYDRYNFRYGEDGVHQKLTWDEHQDEIMAFKEKYIYPTIINQELENKEMLMWVHSRFSRHRYDDVEGIDKNEDDEDENDDETEEVQDEEEQKDMISTSNR